MRIRLEPTLNQLVPGSNPGAGISPPFSPVFNSVSVRFRPAHKPRNRGQNGRSQVIYKIAKVQKGDLSIASTPRVTSASRAVVAASTSGGTRLEVALRDWLSELRLSNRSQTTIDWYRDLRIRTNRSALGLALSATYV